ncbi:LysR family transcriptional regulator [Arthrobacter sp. SDTb3-6]|uniref:LysR family transcriptional regulator n=1 Tax=Arthrobacter sp. SDTb3-6 TaxID=2713571 RepID=UPI001C3FF6D3|nr:LysR family transcriptional regulator [Arthrobacter sp. SDTb3-6]
MKPYTRGQDLMDLKQLLAIVTVSETRSVTRAAEILHLVQPAVTRQIRLLEQELGVTLFERNRHGMQPTDAGEAMVKHARRVLHDVARAKAEVGPSLGSVRGLVAMGLLPSTTELLAVPLVEAVAAQYPGIKLRLRVGYSGDLQQHLDRGEVDAALLYEAQGGPTLNTRPLLSEKLWAVAAKGSGLATRDSVPLAELTRHALALPATGQGIRTLLNLAAAAENLELEPAVETDSMDVQKRLAMSGGFWSALPACCLVSDLAEGRVEAAPLEAPVIERSIILVTARDALTRQAVKAVSDIVAALASDLVKAGDWPSGRLPSA